MGSSGILEIGSNLNAKISQLLLVILPIYLADKHRCKEILQDCKSPCGYSAGAFPSFGAVRKLYTRSSRESMSPFQP